MTLKKVFQHAKNGTLPEVLVKRFRWIVEEDKKNKKRDYIQSVIETAPFRDIQKLIQKKYHNIAQDTEYLQLFSELLYESRENKCNFREYDRFLKLTEQKISSEMLSCEEWKDLTFILMCNGLFRGSNLFRGKLIEKAYFEEKEKKQKGLGDIERAFRASMDQRDFGNSILFLNKLNKKLSKNKITSYYYNPIEQYLICFVFQKREKNLRFFDVTYSPPILV